MKYTIQDLKDGKVAIENDDNKLLISIMGEAFPNCAIPQGTDTYYFAHNSYLWVSYNNIINVKGIPIVKASEWYLQGDRKIIGYKCPTDLFNGDIKKGDIMIPFLISPLKRVVGMYVKEGYNKNGFQTLPKEIVETWEPVYEQEFKAGDWINIFERISGDDLGVFQITEITMEGNIPWLKFTGRSIKRNGFAIDHYRNKFRKATKEEIEEANNISFAGHKAEFIETAGTHLNNNNTIVKAVKFGCQTFTSAEIDSYINLLERNGTSVSVELKISGNVVSLDLLKRIKERL